MDDLIIFAALNRFNITIRKGKIYEIQRDSIAQRVFGSC
jgi:hypothetical protein